MATKSVELAKECKRQYENCLYTAVSLHIWLRWLRSLKVFFAVAPIICGSLGSWKILTDSTSSTMKALGAIGSFLGGLLSTIYSALKLDMHISECKAAAGELTNLRDSFRQAALVSSKKSFEEFEAEVARLRGRLDKVRGMGITAPDVCFKLAQRKISGGDYDFDLDVGAEQPATSLTSPKETPKNLLKKASSSPKSG
jgi:hypothetical protein